MYPKATGAAGPALGSSDVTSGQVDWTGPAQILPRLSKTVRTRANDSASGSGSACRASQCQQPPRSGYTRADPSLASALLATVLRIALPPAITAVFDAAAARFASTQRCAPSEATRIGARYPSRMTLKQGDGTRTTRRPWLVTASRARSGRQLPRVWLWRRMVLGCRAG